MTKKQLEKELEQCMELLAESESEVIYLRKLLKSNGINNIAGDKNFIAPADGELTHENLKLKVRKGFSSDDMKALVDMGNKMIDWCEEKGIVLDDGGSSEDN